MFEALRAFVLAVLIKKFVGLFHLCIFELAQLGLNVSSKFELEVLGSQVLRHDYFVSLDRSLEDLHYHRRHGAKQFFLLQFEFAPFVYFFGEKFIQLPLLLVAPPLSLRGLDFRLWTAAPDGNFF